MTHQVGGEVRRILSTKGITVRTAREKSIDDQPRVRQRFRGSQPLRYIARVPKSQSRLSANTFLKGLGHATLGTIEHDTIPCVQRGTISCRAKARRLSSRPTRTRPAGWPVQQPSGPRQPRLPEQRGRVRDTRGRSAGFIWQFGCQPIHAEGGVGFICEVYQRSTRKARICILCKARPRHTIRGYETYASENPIESLSSNNRVTLVSCRSEQVQPTPTPNAADLAKDTRRLRSRPKPIRRKRLRLREHHHPRQQFPFKHSVSHTQNSLCEALGGGASVLHRQSRFSGWVDLVEIPGFRVSCDTCMILRMCPQATRMSKLDTPPKKILPIFNKTLSYSGRYTTLAMSPMFFLFLSVLRRRTEKP